MNPLPKSARSLSQPEHWLRILADSNPIAIFVCRESILFINRAAARLTGYGKSDLMRMRFDDLVKSDSDSGSGILTCRDGTQRNLELRTS
ncbi:MAG: PAS domain-containing protein [Acidobacteriota bacterium]